MEKIRRVVVTGYGAVTALGGNVQQNWQAIMASRLAYRYHDKSAAGIHARFFALLESEPPLEGVAARVSRRLPRFARLALAAAAEAIEMAFSSSFVGPTHFYSSLECGAIIGSGWGGQDEIMQTMRTICNPGWGSCLAVFTRCPISRPPYVASIGCCGAIKARRRRPARPAASRLAMRLR